MAIVYRNHIAAVDDGTTNKAITTAIATNVNSINFAIATVAWYAGFGADIGLSDSNDNATWTLNTWYPLTVQTLSSVYKCRLFHTKGLTTSGTHYFRALANQSYCSMQVAVFSGVSVDPFDTQGGTTSAAFTTLKPGPLTPSEAGCLVVTGLNNNTNAATNTIDSSYVITDQAAHSGGSVSGGALAYLVHTSGATDPQWTSSIATFGESTIASFKSLLRGGTHNTDARPLGYNAGISRRYPSS